MPFISIYCIAFNTIPISNILLISAYLVVTWPSWPLQSEPTQLFVINSNRIIEPLGVYRDGNPPVTSEFPFKRVRHAKSVSISWPYHVSYSLKAITK